MYALCLASVCVCGVPTHVLDWWLRSTLLTAQGTVEGNDVKKLEGRLSAK